MTKGAGSYERGGLSTILEREQKGTDYRGQRERERSRQTHTHTHHDLEEKP